MDRDSVIDECASVVDDLEQQTELGDTLPMLAEHIRSLKDSKPTLSAQYVATGLEACHKRIAQLEAALRECREFVDGTGDYPNARELLFSIDAVLE